MKITVTSQVSRFSRFLYIFIMILFFLGCPSEDLPPELPSEDPQEFIDQGWAAFSSELFSDALTSFDEALSISPTNVSANMGMAWSMFFLDNGEDENSLLEMSNYFEKGIIDSIWSADAFCGLVIVKFAQENYSGAISYSDSLRQIDPLYVFQYYPELNYVDILIVKAQAQFLTQNYLDANLTIKQLNPSLFLDPDSDSWNVNGVQYNSFEVALSASISSLSLEYDSGGFISNP
jgi:tetratricopeptide (TPR) repeat protein